MQTAMAGQIPIMATAAAIGFFTNPQSNRGFGSALHSAVRVSLPRLIGTADGQRDVEMFFRRLAHGDVVGKRVRKHVGWKVIRSEHAILAEGKYLAKKVEMYKMLGYGKKLTRAETMLNDFISNKIKGNPKFASAQALEDAFRFTRINTFDYESRSLSDLRSAAPHYQDHSGIRNMLLKDAEDWIQQDNLLTSLKSLRARFRAGRVSPAPAPTQITPDDIDAPRTNPPNADVPDVDRPRSNPAPDADDLPDNVSSLEEARRNRNRTNTTSPPPRQNPPRVDDGNAARQLDADDAVPTPRQRPNLRVVENVDEIIDRLPENERGLMRQLKKQLDELSIPLRNPNLIRPALKVLGVGTTVVMVRRIHEAENPNEEAAMVSMEAAAFASGAKAGTTGYALAMKMAQKAPGSWLKLAAGVAGGIAVTVLSDSAMRSFVQKFELETSEEMKDFWEKISYASGGFIIDPVMQMFGDDYTPRGYLEKKITVPIPGSNFKNAYEAEGFWNKVKGLAFSDLHDIYLNDVADWNEYVAEHRDEKIAELTAEVTRLESESETESEDLLAAELALEQVEQHFVPIDENWDKEKATQLTLLRAPVETLRLSLIDDGLSEQFFEDLEKIVITEGGTLTSLKNHDEKIESLTEVQKSELDEYIQLRRKIEDDIGFYKRIGRYSDEWLKADFSVKEVQELLANET
jgi:hypothetical protein